MSDHGRFSGGTSGSPGHTTWPCSACSHPHSTFSSVVLPEPDGPTSPTISPAYSVRSAPRRAWTSSGPRRYDLWTSRASTRGIPGDSTNVPSDHSLMAA